MFTKPQKLKVFGLGQHIYVVYIQGYKMGLSEGTWNILV
jgi:hypothetical protein